MKKPSNKRGLKRGVKKAETAAKSGVFLDFAAGTPLGPRARAALISSLDNFANASSPHSPGLFARRAIEGARSEIARELEVHKDEIIFTSGGTEGNNIIISGIINEALNSGIKKPHVITSPLEHGSVLEVIRNFEKNKKIEVNYIYPKEEEIVDLDKLKESIRDNTILITFGFVNGEIGAIFPIRKISKIIKEYKEKNKRNKLSYPYFHTDGSQSAELLPLNPNNLGVDFLTVDSGKIYGPKGIGFVYKKRGLKISPVIFGGGQEGGLRSGTLNTPGIVSTKEALLESIKLREKNIKHYEVLKKYFEEKLKKISEKIIFTGNSYQTLPNFCHILLPGLDSEFAVMELDALSVSASAASACMSENGNGFSEVVAAIPGLKDYAGNAIRFTFGRTTTKGEIDKASRALGKIITRHRI